MKLTGRDRECIERALDQLSEALEAGVDATGAQIVRAKRAYYQAVSIVRDRPDGQRKVRSDFAGERGPQMRRPGRLRPQREFPL